MGYWLEEMLLGIRVISFLSFGLFLFSLTLAKKIPPLVQNAGAGCSYCWTAKSVTDVGVTEFGLAGV